MKGLLICCFVLTLSMSEQVCSNSSRSKRQEFPKGLQNINIDTYLKNDRAVKFQLRCLLDNGPCDNVGKMLKVAIPQFLVHHCDSCDQNERDRAHKILSHIQRKFPQDWERLVLKFAGGLVSPEDAAKLEKNLGIKLESKLVGPFQSTRHMMTSTTTARGSSNPADIESSSTTEVEVEIDTTSSSAIPSSSPSEASPPPPPPSSSESVLPAVLPAEQTTSTTTVTVPDSENNSDHNNALGTLSTKPSLVISILIGLTKV